MLLHKTTQAVILEICDSLFLFNAKYNDSTTDAVDFVPKVLHSAWIFLLFFLNISRFLYCMLSLEIFVLQCCQSVYLDTASKIARCSFSLFGLLLHYNFLMFLLLRGCLFAILLLFSYFSCYRLMWMFFFFHFKKKNIILRLFLIWIPFFILLLWFKIPQCRLHIIFYGYAFAYSWILNLLFYCDLFVLRVQFFF